MRPPLDYAAIAARLADDMPRLVEALVQTDPTSRTRSELRFGRKGSLAIVIAGPKRGDWFDHEAGQGGDALALIAHLRRCPMRDARAWALAWLGLRPEAPLAAVLPHQAPRPLMHEPYKASTASRRSSATRELARRLWREAVPADAKGSLVPIYLASRGLAIERGMPLRFHPDCPRHAERWPAMLALMTDPTTGEACGVHRTFLARDGSGKAPGPMPEKMMAGHAGVVRLVPDAEVTLGLGIAEGIETALSVTQAFGWRPVWAATSASAVRAFPVLAGIEALTIWADPESAGMDAAEVCADRWAGEGREVRVLAPPVGGGDFNDLIRERAV